MSLKLHIRLLFGQLFSDTHQRGVAGGLGDRLTAEPWRGIVMALVGERLARVAQHVGLG
jgi:hypothetical protein